MIVNNTYVFFFTSINIKSGQSGCIKTQQEQIELTSYWNFHCNKLPICTNFLGKANGSFGQSKFRTSLVLSLTNSGPKHFHISTYSVKYVFELSIWPIKENIEHPLCPHDPLGTSLTISLENMYLYNIHVLECTICQLCLELPVLPSYRTSILD